MLTPMLLGLTQDGTSNGSLVDIVDRIVAAALVASVGIFAVLLVFPQKAKGKVYPREVTQSRARVGSRRFIAADR